MINNIKNYFLELRPGLKLYSHLMDIIYCVFQKADNMRRQRPGSLVKY